jgi:hypothetical protein
VRYLLRCFRVYVYSASWDACITSALYVNSTPFFAAVRLDCRSNIRSRWTVFCAFQNHHNHPRNFRAILQAEAGAKRLCSLDSDFTLFGAQAWKDPGSYKPLCRNIAVPLNCFLLFGMNRTSSETVQQSSVHIRTCTNSRPPRHHSWPLMNFNLSCC